MEKMLIRLRRCRRCDKIFKSRYKKGKICDECRLPRGYRRNVKNQFHYKRALEAVINE